jgi:hypothetical protein
MNIDEKLTQMELKFSTHLILAHCLLFHEIYLFFKYKKRRNELHHRMNEGMGGFSSGINMNYMGGIRWNE